jgi:ERCC4-related helicase
MVESPTEGKVRARKEIERNSQEVSTVAVTSQQAMNDEVRDELTNIIQDMLMKAHEMAFEYSTMECEQINSCPLAKKSRELFKTVKKLNEYVKKLAPQTPATYIR